MGPHTTLGEVGWGGAHAVKVRIRVGVRDRVSLDGMEWPTCDKGGAY